MGKRNFSDSNDLEPSRKKPHNGIQPGDILTDITGKQWKLGKPVGEGAFGELFTASDCTTKEVNDHSPFVVKVELHSNGPLFVETHFYIRAAKQEQIHEWKVKCRRTIGLSHYIASGSHIKASVKYRFLVLPRYSIDLQKVLDKHSNKFNIKTVLTIALQLVDILEYIHSKGFIHGDIKASNILINEKKLHVSKSQDKETCNLTGMKGSKGRRTTRSSLRNKCVLRPPSVESESKTIVTTEKDCNNNIDLNQVYLLDFGLASKYLHSNGKHKLYCIDQRKAHAGTILFCSADAHNGASSRRSDLECLGFNMVHWLTGTLPWEYNVTDYEIVKKKKQICMQELNNFLHISFGKNVPTFLRNYFNYVKNLEFTEKPDYEFLRKVLIQGFTEYGYKKVFTLDFENKEGFGIKKKRIWRSENDRRRASVVCSIIRTPLRSNQPKVELRKKNNAAARMLRWSNILIFDPEVIIKSANKIKMHEDCDYVDGLQKLNLDKLNPTEAMINVYNNYFERQYNSDSGQSSKNVSSDQLPLEGYNATMMQIYNKIVRRRDKCDTLNKKQKKVGRILRRKVGNPEVQSKENVGPINDLPRVIIKVLQDSKRTTCLKENVQRKSNTVKVKATTRSKKSILKVKSNNLSPLKHIKDDITSEFSALEVKPIKRGRGRPRKINH